MTGFDLERVQQPPNVRGQFSGAPAVSGRFRRLAEARQIRTHYAILARKVQDPAGPGARGFGIAVHHHHGLGNNPRFAEPMVLIGYQHCGPNFQIAHMVAHRGTLPFYCCRGIGATAPPMSARKSRRRMGPISVILDVPAQWGASSRPPDLRKRAPRSLDLLSPLSGVHALLSVSAPNVSFSCCGEADRHARIAD